MPFGLAGVVNRVLLSFVPLLVVLIPSLRAIPTALRLRARLHTWWWYLALLTIEREMLSSVSPLKQRQLLDRLGDIEKAVDKMRVPASFADQFYGLRGDIGFVRARLNQLSHTQEERAQINLRSDEL